MIPKGVCQYPLPENPDGICGHPRSGRGRRAYCPEHAPAGYKAKASTRRALLRQQGLLRDQELADRYINRRSVVKGAIATTAALTIPLQNSVAPDVKEECWRLLSGFRHELLTVPRPWNTIADQAKKFARKVPTFLKDYIGHAADPFALACKRLLLSVGVGGDATKAFNFLHALASAIDAQSFLIAERTGNWRVHAFDLQVHAQLFRTYREVLPATEQPRKTWSGKKAMQYAQRAYALLRRKCRASGGNGYDEDVYHLLFQATLLQFKLVAYDNDPAIRAQALPYLRHLRELAKDID